MHIEVKLPNNNPEEFVSFLKEKLPIEQRDQISKGARGGLTSLVIAGLSILPSVIQLIQNWTKQPEVQEVIEIAINDAKITIINGKLSKEDLVRVNKLLESA